MVKCWADLLVWGELPRWGLPCFVAWGARLVPLDQAVSPQVPAPRLLSSPSKSVVAGGSESRPRPRPLLPNVGWVGARAGRVGRGTSHARGIREAA